MFPFPLLSCIMPPVSTYADRIFTTGEVGVSGSPHIPTKDFSALIKRAQELPGFTYEAEE